MEKFTYKSNEIEITNEQETPNITIGGNNIDVESRGEIFTTPLAFDDFVTLEDLARGVVDTQLALEDAELELEDEMPPTTATELEVRRNLAELSDDDRNKFRDALFLLKERGEYDKYIKFHGFTDNLGHSGPAFFAWHRVFLRKFEKELQNTDVRFADVTLPYWDYTSPNIDNQGNSKIWRNEFLGENGDVDLTWTGEDGSAKKWILPGYQALNNQIQQRDGIRRRTFNMTNRFVPPSQFNDALRVSDYRDFEPRFEGGPHGGAHVTLGTNRDQGSFATAVNDPFFMLLHCNVDRMWAKWQQLMKIRWLDNNPGAEYPANQLAEDYFWNKSNAAHTAPNANAPGAAVNRHNLDDIFWPWDATRSHSDRADSQFVQPQDSENYTPRRVLNHETMGYTYDNLSPTGFVA